MSTQPGSGLPSPDAAALREAALRHLSRYAASSARLLAVLHRRIERWARAAGQAGQDQDSVRQAGAASRAAAASVVERLVQTGVLDDAAFAASRARSLLRAGKSRARAAETLGRQGIPRPAAHAAVEGADEGGGADLVAALILVRRRRLGRFAAPEPDADRARLARSRALGVLARAGFSHADATQALAMDTAQAEALILERRAKGWGG